MKTESEHLFGVEFCLEHENSSRYCEIIAKQSDDIFEVLQDVYDDLMSISSIEDQGECNEDGELIDEN